MKSNHPSARIATVVICAVLSACSMHAPDAAPLSSIPLETVSFEPASLPGPEEGFGYAVAAYKVGDMDTARLIAQQVMEQFPNTVWQKRSLFLLGRAFIALDMAPEAEAVMLRTESEYPVLADYAIYLLAEYFYSKASYENAARYYQRLLERHPDSFWVIHASFKMARALLSSGAYREAAEAFEKFLRTYPRSDYSPEAGLGLGRALLAEGRLELAARAFRDVCIRYPGSPYDQEVEQALKEIASKGVEPPEPTAEERYERARNLFKTEQYDRAYESFTALLNDEPNHPQRTDILFRIGLSLLHLGRRGEGVAALERLMNERPPARHGAEALNWLGRVYSRLGRREEAVNAYLKIVAAYPDSELADDALYLIGNLYRDANETKNALAFYDRLARTYPDSKYADSAFWWKAWAYYTSGDYQKTVQVLKELIARYPKSFLVNQALYWQGRAMERMGRPDKAASYYQAVLRRGPYSYYGHRAAERLSLLKPSAVSAALPLDSGRDGPIEPAPSPENGDSLEDSGPPVWTQAAIDALTKEPSLRKVLELMRHELKKEAAAELWSLKDRVPKRHGALLGLSKVFFELGDYYRSLIIVLRNYERYLDGPSEDTPQDFWLLSYPLGYWESILSASKRFGQDPYFVAAIIHQESQFHRDAVSPAGARGVMQVMPSTGEWVAQAIRLIGFDKDRLFEPETGITIGTWYISHLMKKFKGDPLLVAAAYNAGPEAVSSWLSRNGSGLERDEFVESIPFSETRGYVKKVMRNYAEYRRIYGKTAPATMLAPLPILEVLENER